MRHTERELAEGGALVGKGCVRLQSIGNRLGARRKRRGYHKRNEDVEGDINRTGEQTQHCDALNPRMVRWETPLTVVASLRFVRAIEGLRTDPRLS